MFVKMVCLPVTIAVSTRFDKVGRGALWIPVVAFPRENPEQLSGRLVVSFIWKCLAVLFDILSRIDKITGIKDG
jgi:hypothetical protein